MEKSKKCLYSGCNKEAISFSNYCGKHTSNRQIIAKLRNTRLKNFKSLYLDEVEIKRVSFVNKRFESFTLIDTEFQNVTFRNCSFYSCGFSNSEFIECTFINCYFYQWDCKDVTFSETIFNDCSFEDWILNQCYFGSDTAILNSNIDACECIGGFFGDTGLFNNVKFLSTNFIQTSFSRALFQSCQFIEPTFTKTSLYDSSFLECSFNSVSDDFKLTGVPKLCDFRGGEFINMSISKDMREWNNFNRPPVTYYLDIVKKLLPVKHPNYLSELGIALNHLLALSFIPSVDMIEQINDLFTRLLQEAAWSNDYSTIGNVLSDYGKVPQIFRKKTSFILPPPKEPVDFNESNRTLKITVSLSEWTLAQTARFTNLLNQLENNLPGKSGFGVNYIEHGSLIIQLVGHVQQLFGALRMLVDLKKTKVEIDSIEIESSKKLLELRKLEIDLTHYESMKEIELEKAKVDLEKTKIDVAKTKLEFLNAAQKQFGFDYVKFNRSLKGKETKKIADIIQKEFPVISLKLE